MPEPQLYYTRQGFQDPRRPKDRFMDIISGAARDQYPLGNPDPLRTYAAPPAQESAERAQPVEPVPPAPQPAAPQENPNLYGQYKEALGRPQPTEKPQPKWKQALGYAAAAFRPTRGTDLPERLIVGDENLRSRRAREAELSAAKERGAVAEKEEEAGIKRRTTATGERNAAVGERGATTAERKQKFEEETFPVRTQVDILKAGGRPPDNKIAVPSGREGEESVYTFPKRTVTVPEKYREQAGGLEEIPENAVAAFISNLNRDTGGKYASAGGGIIYNKETGQYVRVEPVEGVTAHEPGQVLYRGGEQIGTVPGQPRTAQNVQTQALRRYNDTITRAKNAYINNVAAGDDEQQEAAAFEMAVEQAKMAYQAEAGPGAPPPPDPLVDTAAAEQAVGSKLSSMTPRPPSVPGAVPGGPPIGPTVPPEPPQVGATTPPGPPPVPQPPTGQRSEAEILSNPQIGDEIVRDGVTYRWDGALFQPTS